MLKDQKKSQNNQDNTSEQVTQDIPEESTETSADADLDATKDQLLRALAEIENLKKRSAREQEDARKYALGSFARDLLSVVDNLDRAFESLEGQQKTTHEDVKTIVNGIKLVRKELHNLLERHHVLKIKALGEIFNPDLHQVITEVHDDTQEEGTISQVLQEGYTLSGRLLRPTLVNITTSTPKAEE